MDQVQIGKFIAACRKERGLTQAQLAEKMNVSDRAVSKWETGKNLPDSSIMLPLCDELHITVNDMLNGRRITMENYKEIAEKTMLEMREAKEKNDRMMLDLEILIGLLTSALLVSFVCFASYAAIPDWLRIVLIVVAFAQFVPCILYALRIEQIAGYYECKKCGHRWVPTFAQVLFSPHIHRSRKMTCPHCGKRSYHKKTLTKVD